VRLAKFLANAGVASRRAAEEIIRSGRVRIDGAIVDDPARDVAAGMEVTLDGRQVATGGQMVVYMLNKPLGVVSTASDPQRRPTVVSLVPSELRLYPVGRLDIDSTGLILLTNDGELAHRLTHPSFEVPKTYRAVLARPPVREREIRELREGIELDDGRTAPARVTKLKPDTIELQIHEGRKRQVRRMCEAAGHPVIALSRVGFGPLTLGGLKLGAHRRLAPAELSALRAAGRSDRRGGAPSSAAPGRRPER
jgi:23S rRNA pseudouridine2605 synthase